MNALIKALLISLTLFCVAVSIAPTPASAHGSEQDGFREHTVYAGQRLGSIAKRYNVPIAAICYANGIERRDPIRPGQRLLIPKRHDKDGSEARALRLSGKWPANEDTPSAADDAETQVAPLKNKPRTHTVASGQRLGSIAKRYHVTVSAICNANGIQANRPIRPKQQLLIPPRFDKQGSRTRQWRLEQAGSGSKHRQQRGSWSAYKKTPSKRGYVSLIGHQERWEGYVLGPKGQVLGNAQQAISRILTAPSNRQPINRRLIQLVAEVSDTFGGRPLRVISGYRTTSFVKDSRHKSGRALDFRIPGIPNEALRDYLRTFEQVGVGYYPNSTFVHLDVRTRATYWVDYAGPGEAPRLKPRR